MKPPIQVTPKSIDIQSATVLTLSNGVKLHIIDCSQEPVVRLSLVFRAGSVHQNVPFSAVATANLLSEGSANLSAKEIAEQLDFLGSYFEVNIDRDFSYITFSALNKLFAQTIDVAEEIVLRPEFPEREVATYCTKRKQQTQIERQKVETIAREAFGAAMYGSTHPYGVSYSEELYDSLRREDVVEFYRQKYVASNCFAVCSGCVKEAELVAITSFLEKLPTTNSLSNIPIPTPEITRERFIEQPTATQSAIRIGRPLFGRSHPDFVPMQVVATALGGYFGSRLMQNLRERNGYTYGVFAGMVNLQHAGHLAIATQVSAEATTEAVEQIYLELERMCSEQMSQTELEDVKRVILGEMMRILDGPFGIADATIESVMLGADNQIMQQNLELINSLTPTDIQRLSQKYLKHEDLVTVVVGHK